jgi:ABC-type dipeptide/oligopeptide/nickel transport system ATPase component
VYEIADRIAVMQNGKIIEIAAPQVLLHSPVHAHSKELVLTIVNESDLISTVTTR